MADITGASLAPIYNRLNTTPSYHPLEADTFADWSLEAGDVVTVTRDGRGYQSPVHSSILRWKKQPQMTISSTGNEARESVAKMSQKKFRNGSGGLRANNYQHIYVDDAYGRMRSGLELTGSSAALYVEDKYRQMKSGLDLTSSSAHLYVDDRYKQMRSGLSLTSSSAALYVEDRYRQMKSGLDLTSSSAALYVDNKYAQMRSGLNLTSSSAALYVDNRYAQMRSGLNLTSSSAALYVDNRYAQMRSGLDLTSSSAALYVDNRYAQMRSGLDLTSSSAALYARSADNAAEIVARINESTGESEIKLSSDRVYIGNSRSTTVINGKCELSDVTANYIGSKIASLATVNVQQLSSERGGVSVYSVGTTNFSQGGVSCYVPNAIWALQIVQDGNNYKLQRQRYNDDGWTDVGTFSRAVTSWTMGWSGGTFTAKANPQNQSCSTQIVQGTVSWDGNNATVPIDGIDSDNPGYQYFTGRNILVDASGRYSAGRLSGWEDCYDDIGLNYSSNQTIDPGGQITIYPAAKPTPSGQHASITTRGITVYASSASTPEDLSLWNGDTRVTESSPVDLGFGSSVVLTPYYKVDGEWVAGTPGKVTSPADPHPTRYSLKCTGASQAGGVVTYTFTTDGGSFSTGTSYYFYR